MTERNEMEHAASPDIGPQPSLDLPGRRKTRVGKLRLVLVALAVIALGASGVTIYLQRLFQQHQDAKQAALNKPKDSGASDAGADLETQKDTYQARGSEQARAGVGGGGRRCAIPGLRRRPARHRRRAATNEAVDREQPAAAAHAGRAPPAGQRARRRLRQ